MGNVSFEEFYYSKDNQIHDISEVQKEYDQCSGDISKFKNQMFCPECKKAKLSFTHRTSFKRAFLSKKRSSDHVEGCSFIHDSASKRDILEYIKQLSTNQIQDRLEAALNQLLLKKTKADNDASNECKDNPLVIKVDNPRGSGIRKFIPRKSINSWFDKLEECKMFIFYGHVKLEIENIKKENITFFRLIIKAKKQNQWIKKTSIFRGITKDNIDEEKIYDIAVLGEIEFYNGFPQIKTAKYDSIMFRETRM